MVFDTFDTEQEGLESFGAKQPDPFEMCATIPWRAPRSVSQRRFRSCGVMACSADVASSPRAILRTNHPRSTSARDREGDNSEAGALT